MAKDVRALRDEAAEASAAGKHKKALTAYLELEQLEPRDAQWAKRAGETYRKLGNNKSAVEAFERSADRYAQNGFLVQAIAVCKVILQMDPQHASALGRLAQMNEQAGQGPTRAQGYADNNPALAKDPRVVALRHGATGPLPALNLNATQPLSIPSEPPARAATSDPGFARASDPGFSAGSAAKSDPGFSAAKSDPGFSSPRTEPAAPRAAFARAKSEPGLQAAHNEVGVPRGKVEPAALRPIVTPPVRPPDTAGLAAEPCEHGSTPASDLGADHAPDRAPVPARSAEDRGIASATEHRTADRAVRTAAERAAADRDRAYA